MTNQLKRKRFFVSIISVWIMSLIAGSSFFGIKTASAQTGLLQITSIRFAARDTSFIIYWRTNLEATGFIKYGLTNGFGSSMTDNVLGKYHETVIGGLMPNTTYYFQLIATDANGYQVSSLVYDQTTIEVVPTDPPAITEVTANFVSGNTAQIVWRTPRDATSCVRYGLAMIDLSKQVCEGNMVKLHDLVIKGLSQGTQYFFQVVSKDKYNNEQSSTYFTFYTISANDGQIAPLEVLAIEPYATETNGQAELHIYSTTNHPVYGDLYFGPDKNNFKLYPLIWTYRQTKIDWHFSPGYLELDKDYFYYFKFKDIFGQELQTPTFKLRTTPVRKVTSQIIDPIIINVNGGFDDPQADPDGDGLTNEQEGYYGTDVRKFDTDGDTYSDGSEVAHGYNPLGPGKLTKPLFKNTTKIYAYGKPRLKDLNLEAAYAESLYRELNKKFTKGLNVSPGDWMYYIKAYVYGNYPVSAIYQDVRFKGKTVHPTKAYEVYKTTTTFKTYINKK